MKLRWRFGIIAGLFLAIFSLYPQFKLIYMRGAEWNGHYAYNDIDEVAYASYLKALIDGRPRKNDPYSGRDESVEAPQPESLFSIQFAGPYTVAIPARILGVEAPWAMTISGAVAAFLTAIAIFWLVGQMTEDSLFAMASSLIVLAGGALFAGEGAIGEILGTGYSYPYFPGFRRYIPAIAFPAFFALIGTVWKLLGAPPPIRQFSNQRLFSTMPFLLAFSVLAFGYLVFSYFYVWTTAAAWLGCLVLCWLVLRPDGARKDLRVFLGLGAGCLTFLAPYAYLLSQRSHSMDDVQLLVRTRMPDLLRTPELIGFGVLAVLASAIFMKVLNLRDRGTLFAISLALTPFAVFNQQILTGQSLQPIHYQVFIGNYVAGLAMVITLGLLWRTVPGRERVSARILMASVAFVAALWGFVECHYTVAVLDDVNVIRDEALPVAKRLSELGGNDPDVHKKVVLHLGIAEADDLPTVAPQSVLWARHQHVFSGVSWQENKERYYQLLYYQGISPRQLAHGITSGNDFVSMIALFGWGRHTDRLNAGYKPLTVAEIDDEAGKFEAYAKTFNAANVGVPQLDYLITRAGTSTPFENLDKWYIRDNGEKLGNYVLFKLQLR